MASEDTVLYTAQQYVNHITAIEQKQQAGQQLARLIRCTRLSTYWLSVSVHSPFARGLLLNCDKDVSSHVKELLLMRQANPAEPVPANAVMAVLSNAPAWLAASRGLPPRAERQVSSVQLQWSVNVDDIKAAAQRSSNQPDGRSSLTSPILSPPLGGISFGMMIECVWDSDNNGSRIGVSADADNVPMGTYFQCTFELSCDKCPTSTVCMSTGLYPAPMPWRE